MADTHLQAHDRFLALAHRITYPGLVLEVEWETVNVFREGEAVGTYHHAGHYLRVSCPEGSCNLTAADLPWKGRKWRLSRHMTDMEFVLTAFKAILTALEHEAREVFKVDGVALLDSHLDLERSLAFMKDGGGGHGRH